MSHVCLAFSKLSSLIQARVVVWPSFTNGNATHSPKLPTEGPEDTGEDDDKVLYTKSYRTLNLGRDQSRSQTQDDAATTQADTKLRHAEPLRSRRGPSPRAPRLA